MKTGWDRLTLDTKAAVQDAMDTLDRCDVRFILVTFAPTGEGAIMSNIAPHLAIRPLETALAAARTGVPVEVVVERRDQ